MGGLILIDPGGATENHPSVPDFECMYTNFPVKQHLHDHFPLRESVVFLLCSFDLQYLLELCQSYNTCMMHMCMIVSCV